MEIEVNLPDKCDLNALENFINEYEISLISHVKKGDTILFNISKTHLISPTFALYLISRRDLLSKRGCKTLINKGTERNLTKFLRILKIIPALPEDMNDLYIKNMKKYSIDIKKCYNIDECFEINKNITSLLKNRFSIENDILASIDFMINEIYDNAGCHGYRCYEQRNYPEPIYICAFSYKSYIEIAILDLGQGIHTSLKTNNPKLKNINANEALLTCIDNTVSGHPNGSPGFGLFATSKLIEMNNTGGLKIWSSMRRLNLDSNIKNVENSKFRIGTLVSINVNKLCEMNFNSIVNTYKSADDYLETYGIIQDENQDNQIN